MSFKPLLAYTVKDMEAVKFPVLVSPKLDGIRCVIRDYVPVSRTLKDIPNQYVQNELAFYPPFDGELLVGDPLDPTAFNQSTRGIMSRDGSPEFTFWVFDFIHEGIAVAPFRHRFETAKEYIGTGKYPKAQLVPHTQVDNHAELLELEQYYVSLGYEGVMIRNPRGPYKYGRSTERQGYLGKVKRFDDCEGIIVGFEELMHNENDPEVNKLGYQERSHALAGQVPSNTLGSLIVKHQNWQETFGIGTGFSAEERFTLWQIRDTLKGKRAKFKHQPSGAKDKPRFPVYLGLRED